MPVCKVLCSLGPWSSDAAWFSVRTMFACAALLAFHGTIAAEERHPSGKNGAPATIQVPADHAARMKAGQELFRREVRAVLVEHCLACHGGESVKADFDLSTREALMDSGMVGDSAEESHLISLITHQAEPHMPFKAARLAEQQIDAIRRWIDLGAPYDRPLVEKKDGAPAKAAGITEADRMFWSFRPLANVRPPAIDAADPHAAWCRTPIDQFILAAQRAAGVYPNPPADRRTLIRRVYFDLLGFPPSPEEVAAFVADPSPDAYARLIDRLLESPHYGERWARHWMDVARFAESHGYEQDYDRPHAYHYRDFLIQAFNAGMPYDQFVRWQLAGDELEPDHPLAMMATGFLGGGAFPTQLTEAEFESARYDELDDMVATTGVAFLGLSIGCARCHDHKFDPIPSHDYYRLAATFTTTIRSEIDLKVPHAAEPVKVQVSSEGFPHMKHHADARGYPHFYPQTFHLARGDVSQKLQPAEPGFLQVLMRDGKSPEHWRREPPPGWERTSFRRAALAAWITDPHYGAGHLAARVMVNRVWQHHFGVGIVATPNDFGFQGEPPTHPELLDWLAADFIAHGWQLKRLHKQIMTSAVYMQGNQVDAARATIDPENRLLWHRTPRRLEAEAIRDAMLVVSGLLDDRMFGPGTLDEGMRRRSVYFFIKRSELIPMMMLLDWPEHLVSIGRRAITTTAPQALLFMNNPQARSYAEGLAARAALRGADDTDQAFIDAGFALVFQRAATDAERQFAQAFLKQQSSLHAAAGHAADAARRLARIDLCQALLSMNEFVYID